jgi:hypothetical protein
MASIFFFLQIFLLFFKLELSKTNEQQQSCLVSLRLGLEKASPYDQKTLEALALFEPD